MSGLGKLTVRFGSGEIWSAPFTGQQALELAEALDDVSDPRGWVVLKAADEEQRDQLLISRQQAMESLLWVEEPGMMEAASEGELGDDFAAGDEE